MFLRLTVNKDLAFLSQTAALTAMPKSLAQLNQNTHARKIEPNFTENQAFDAFKTQTDTLKFTVSAALIYAPLIITYMSVKFCIIS